MNCVPVQTQIIHQHNLSILDTTLGKKQGQKGWGVWPFNITKSDGFPWYKEENQFDEVKSSGVIKNLSVSRSLKHLVLPIKVVLGRCTLCTVTEELKERRATRAKVWYLSFPVDPAHLGLGLGNPPSVLRTNPHHMYQDCVNNQPRRAPWVAANFAQFQNT